MTAVLLTACGSSGSSESSATTVPPATTAVPATTAAPTTTPATTGATTTGAATTQPEEPSQGDVIEIDVKVGVDDSPTRIEKVPLNAQVVITLQSDSDEVYHLHGYDLEQKAAAGTEAQFSFTADMAGQFELESHTTDKVLMILQVG